MQCMRWTRFHLLWWFFFVPTTNKERGKKRNKNETKKKLKFSDILWKKSPKAHLYSNFGLNLIRCHILSTFSSNILSSQCQVFFLICLSSDFTLEIFSLCRCSSNFQVRIHFNINWTYFLNVNIKMTRKTRNSQRIWSRNVIIRTKKVCQWWKLVCSDPWHVSDSIIVILIVFKHPYSYYSREQKHFSWIKIS